MSERSLVPTSIKVVLSRENIDQDCFYGQERLQALQNIGNMGSNYTSLPLNFQTSYQNRDTFPSNCMQTTIDTYPSALAEYATRLDEAAGDLCEVDIEEVDVSFRDLRIDQGAGKGEFKGQD